MGSNTFGFNGEVASRVVRAENDLRRLESLIVRPTYTGTAFPTSPSSGDIFYRTDLGMMFYYAGSEWRSEEQYFFWGDVLSSDEYAGSMPMRQDMEYVVTKLVFRTYPTSPNDNSHHWNVIVRGGNLALSAFTTHYTFSTEADTDDAWTEREVNPTTASPGANDYWLSLYGDADGSPGDLIVYVTVYFYWIAT